MNKLTTLTCITTILLTRCIQGATTLTLQDGLWLSLSLLVFEAIKRYFEVFVITQE